jgi:hypothetical protein
MSTLQEAKWIIGGSEGAAARLGLKSTTLIAKTKKLGISRPAGQSKTRAPDENPGGWATRPCHAMYTRVIENNALGTLVAQEGGLQHEEDHGAHFPRRLAVRPSTSCMCIFQ